MSVMTVGELMGECGVGGSIVSGRGPDWNVLWRGSIPSGRWNNTLTSERLSSFFSRISA